MKCPYCSHLGDKSSTRARARRARRFDGAESVCRAAPPFTSYERIDEIAYMVIRRAARATRSDRQKL